MLRPEMNLPERSEFSSQALLDPASRISVPFYPGNSEFFPVFLNSSSFRQIRIYFPKISAACFMFSIIGTPNGHLVWHAPHWMHSPA